MMFSVRSFIAPNAFSQSLLVLGRPDASSTRAKESARHCQEEDKAMVALTRWKEMEAAEQEKNNAAAVTPKDVEKPS